MLSKFEKLMIEGKTTAAILKKTEFDPLIAIKKVSQDLDSDLETYLSESESGITTESAKEIIEATVHAILNIYINTIHIMRTGTYQQMNQMSKALIGIDLPADSSKTLAQAMIATFTDEMSVKLTSNYNSILKYLTNKDPIEKIHLNLTAILQDKKRAKNQLRTRTHQSKFYDEEVRILSDLVKKVLEPLLDPAFKHYKDRCSYYDGKFNFEIVCESPDNMLFGRYETLENKVEKGNFPESVKHDLQKELDLIKQDLFLCHEIYGNLYKRLKAKAKEINSVEAILPVLRLLYIYPEKKKALEQSMMHFAQKVNEAIRKAKQVKAANKIQKAQAQPLIAESSSEVSVPGTESESESESDDETLISQAQVTQNANDNSPIKESNAIVPSRVEPAKPVINQYTTITKSANEKPAEITNINNPLIKGNPGKVIEKIFSGTKKIKYHDLVVLITGLKGTKNEKTGSSSRKMFLEDQRLFMHKRHGRDRAIYVDPKVIKNVRDMLSALGITAEHRAMPTTVRQRSM